jgi:hypothetical protein
MSIGLGIFFGSLFIGTVFLFTKTRDSWNWRKIWKRLGLSVVFIVALIAVAIASTFGFHKWEERPKVVTSIEGVSLGETLSDVAFRYGEFSKQSSDEQKKVGKDDAESYVSEKKRLMINVRAERIESIVYLCKDDSDYTASGGITCGYSGEAIFSRFGGAVRVKCLIKAENEISKLTRAYDIPKFGIRYLLHQNRVIGFYVMDAKMRSDAIGINWHAC